MNWLQEEPLHGDAPAVLVRSSQPRGFQAGNLFRLPGHPLFPLASTFCDKHSARAVEGLCANGAS
jgi:hypothetical protein